MQDQVDDEPDPSFLHCPFLDPLDFLHARAFLATTPPGWGPKPRRQPGAELPPRDQAALATWAQRGFTEHERDAWMSAGLSRYDAHLAEQCVRFGLTLTDLYRQVDGRRVSHWLCSGESVDQVQARLRSAIA